MVLCAVARYNKVRQVMVLCAVARYNKTLYVIPLYL
jgi:hypothetical protein